MTSHISENIEILQKFHSMVRNKSDGLINYFLIGYYVLGFLFAFFYETWLVAAGVGSLSLLIYYSTKFILPENNLYQYILSIVLGIFMAQYIYQMHGLFEMHFVAFISSAILITYQNWRLQIPLALIVIFHHGLFGFWQYNGIENIYFTQLDYMDVPTFIIHIALAGIIFFICGLWGLQLERYSKKQIKQSSEIAQTNEDLKKANMELDKFVYSVSHDLRAPLSSMLGVIQIAEEDVNDKVLLEQLSMMKRSIHKLDNFVVDILNYSRNSRQEMKITKVVFKEMLEEIARDLKYMSKTSIPVQMLITVNESGFFKSDQSRLNIVLNNLISNAIRYSNPVSENPLVEITVEADENSAQIKVKDNGIGIKKDLQDKIFTMFYRVSENSSGSGLGLYIVKETVEKLNGQINLESEPGVGSEFILTIPGQN